MQKTSMVAPLGVSGAPTINTKILTVGPWEAVPEVRLRPPSTQKMLMVGPLGGGAGGLGASTINEKMSTADPL
jgi:hypothetical protein